MRRSAGLVGCLAVLLTGLFSVAGTAYAYVPVSGAGSTWSQNALNQWITDVQQYGMRINYNGDGSTAGRQAFLNGTVDFAASDIPFQTNPTDGSAPETPKPGSYAYMPITAGGTVFMYNLVINGHRVTNLRLSGQNVTKIFTNVITNWDDPALQADNPGLVLPNRPIVPVVRSDGAGSTAQFTLWMISEYGSLWNAYCQKVTGSNLCGETSNYPTSGAQVAQNGDLGVAGYVSQSFADGAVGYVNYSYALNAGFPVVKLLNAAGYYTQPTPDNVAVSLLKAQVDTQDVNNPALYLTENLSQVYTDPDPRSYPLSSYSYVILPTTTTGNQFSNEKGATLGAFLKYSMCQGQDQSASLGYSPMPINLVQAAFAQVGKIPGAGTINVNINSCNNPTFSSNGVNELALQDPQPSACDKQGSQQNPAGTGGASTTTTPETQAAQACLGGGGLAVVLKTNSPTLGATPVNASTPVAGQPVAATNGGTRVAQRSSTVVPTGRSTTAVAGTPLAKGVVAGATTATTTCDPTTGTCSSASASLGDSSLAAASATATPDTLPTSHGWGTTQTLMVLGALLLLALVFGPGLTARYLAQSR